MSSLGSVIVARHPGSIIRCNLVRALGLVPVYWGLGPEKDFFFFIHYFLTLYCLLFTRERKTTTMF